MVKTMTAMERAAAIAASPHGIRDNAGKVQWSLVHFKSLEPMVRVLEYGAKKYAVDQWKKGLSKKEMKESLMRHVADYIDGVELDAETNCHQLGHILVNAMFLSYFSLPENADKCRP
jgi:hypothetical protein